MTIKTFFFGLLIALLAAAGWRYKDTDTVQQWLRPQDHKPVQIEFDNDLRPSSGPAPQAPNAYAGARTDAPVRAAPSQPGGLRKCRKGSELIYTDGECPPGSREQKLGGGAVTVVPSQGQTAKASSSDTGGSRPNVRDMLIDKNAPDLREQRMEQIINR